MVISGFLLLVFVAVIAISLCSADRAAASFDARLCGLQTEVDGLRIAVNDKIGYIWVELADRPVVGDE